MTPVVRHESRQVLEREIESKLQHFNEQKAGPLNTAPVALSIRGDDERLIAGLVGETFWNVLYIRLLWVDESQRNRGYGSQLLEAAEAIGRDRECEVAYLSTFTFQAPAFYSRRGYTRFGELEGVPDGASRLWFSKSLAI